MSNQENPFNGGAGAATSNSDNAAQAAAAAASKQAPGAENSFSADLSEIDEVRVSGEGKKFTGTGSYLCAVNEVKSFKAAKGSKISGAQVVVFELTVLRVTECDEEAPIMPGMSRSVSINDRNAWGFMPTLKGFCQAMLDLQEHENVSADSVRRIATDPAVTRSALVKVRTVAKVSSTGNPYVKIFWDGRVDSAELAEAEVALLPAGTRESQNLPSPAELDKMLAEAAAAS